MGRVWSPIGEAAFTAARRDSPEYEATIAASVAESRARPLVTERLNAWEADRLAAGVEPTTEDRRWARHDIEVEISRELRTAYDGGTVAAEIAVIHAVAADSTRRAAGWPPALDTGATPDALPTWWSYDPRPYLPARALTAGRRRRVLTAGRRGEDVGDGGGQAPFVLGEGTGSRARQ